MASQAVLDEVLCTIKGTLKLKGRIYDNFTLGIAPELCTDIILGKAFMKQKKT